MAIPQGYDPVLLNHWLWYKYHCHECSFSEFQVLFERIAKRLDPKFMSVRPYGNIGDRKCDGLFLAEDAFTVFQVYSPDEMKQEDILRKIDEDLDGAVTHWSDLLRCWIFVYNVRRGVPPDVPGAIQRKRIKYPRVDIDHWSSDTLWEKIRSLTLQQRAEILGAPSGYEHLFFTAEASDEDVRRRIETGSFVIVQDVLAPINLRAVSEALAPGAPFGGPYLVRPTYADLPWTAAAEEQREMMRELMDRAREVVPRFSVFSLAPVPLAAHLGFLLSDRVEVACYQYDRDAKSWEWPERKARPVLHLAVSGLPEATDNRPVEVAISVSLSASIAEEDVVEAAPLVAYRVRISAAEPDVMWLRSPKQLAALAQEMRRVLTAVRNKLPRARALHLFYAGPTGGAVVVGQAINPRMNPPVHLYEYSQQSSPKYRQAVTLTARLAL